MMAIECYNNSKSPLFITLALLFVSIMLLSAGCIQSNNTPQATFNLDPNETFTMPYNVHNQKWMINPDDDKWVIKSEGYIIASTGQSGVYDMTVTTNSANDIVYLAWAETFTEKVNVGDKFGESLVPMSKMHWVGNVNYYCKSDRYSDCHIIMSEGNYEQPELQIYIYGSGSGDITITRRGGA
jgi:hypothetical protein